MPMLEGKAKRSCRYSRTMPWVSVFQAMNSAWFLLSGARLCLATHIHHLTWPGPTQGGRVSALYLMGRGGTEKVQKRRLGLQEEYLSLMAKDWDATETELRCASVTVVM